MVDEAVEPGEVVGTMTKRFDLLTLLADEERCLRDLRDDLEVSRSTVYKAVRELEAIDTVERTDGEVELTPFGDLVFEHYRTFRRDVERMSRLRTSLPPCSNLQLAPAMFRDAEVVSAPPHDPDRPIDVFEDLVRETDVFRGFSPVARSRYAELFTECALDGELTATIVTEPSAVEVIVSSHGDALETVLGTGQVRLLETDTSLPFSLSCFGDPTTCAVVGIYDERKQLLAILTSEAPAAIAWAERTYERIEDAATALAPEA